jgi:hypothetical protein
VSHKDAPPLTDEQARMEAWYRTQLATRAAAVGFGRDRDGNYFADYARDAWAAWQEAQR